MTTDSDPQRWLQATDGGLYCAPGDFYVDPHRPAERAVITHGHADHARPGHGHVMATGQTLDIMAIRYGADHARATQAAEYGEIIDIGDVSVRFHPAGHVLGSAQIAVEWQGMRIVASGDYKPRPDPTCETFEPVDCDVFITEATFALPVFRHPEAASEIGRLLASLKRNPDRAHMIGAYSLGKAQRLLALVDESIGPILTHGAVEGTNGVLRAQGYRLPETRQVLPDTDAKSFPGPLVLAPPSALGTPWARRFGASSSALSSVQAEALGASAAMVSMKVKTKLRIMSPLQSALARHLLPCLPLLPAWLPSARAYRAPQ